MSVMSIAPTSRTLQPLPRAAVLTLNDLTRAEQKSVRDLTTGPGKVHFSVLEARAVDFSSRPGHREVSADQMMTLIGQVSRRQKELYRRPSEGRLHR